MKLYDGGNRSDSFEYGPENLYDKEAYGFIYFLGKEIEVRRYTYRGVPDFEAWMSISRDGSIRSGIAADHEAFSLDLTEPISEDEALEKWEKHFQSLDERTERLALQQEKRIKEALSLAEKYKDKGVTYNPNYPTCVSYGGKTISSEKELLTAINKRLPSGKERPKLKSKPTYKWVDVQASCLDTTTWLPKYTNLKPGDKILKGDGEELTFIKFHDGNFIWVKERDKPIQRHGLKVWKLQ